MLGVNTQPEWEAQTTGWTEVPIERTLPNGDWGEVSSVGVSQSAR